MALRGPTQSRISPSILKHATNTLTLMCMSRPTRILPPMFGNVTALQGLHVTGKYRDRSMQRTHSRHAAWDPHTALSADRGGFCQSIPFQQSNSLSFCHVHNGIWRDAWPMAQAARDSKPVRAARGSKPVAIAGPQWHLVTATLALARDEVLWWIRHHIVANPHLKDKVLVHIYIYTYIHIHIYTYIHIYIYTYIHVYMYTCIHVYR